MKIIDKEEYKTLEATKRLIDEKLATIRRKETEIQILQREIEQLYEFINDIERIGELETMRIDKLKEWINIVQQNKDNKHLEPFISTDELDELLDILKGSGINE